MTQLRDMKIKAIDLYLHEHKNESEIITTLLNDFSAYSNQSCCDIVSCKVWFEKNMDLLPLYHFARLLQEPNKFVKPHDITSLFIQSITNKEKFNAVFNSRDMTTILGHIKKFTTFEGIAESILFDMANVGSPRQLQILDTSSVKSEFKLMFKKQLPRPALWEQHDAKLAIVADICINAANKTDQGIQKLCQGLNNITDPITKTLSPDLKALLSKTQQPAHFDPNANHYNYPMIPFCWFGGLLYWLGTEKFVSDHEFYNKARQSQGLKEVLKWCDVFKPTFPLRGNCYTTNNLDNSKP